MPKLWDYPFFITDTYLSEPASLDEPITEVTDISLTLGWTLQTIREPNADRLNGICFATEDSESIFLSFLPGDRLYSPINLMCQDIYQENGLDTELLYTASTKK